MGRYIFPLSTESRYAASELEQYEVIHLDDDEAHYLKVMTDEIFGRKNFISNVIWEKKYSPQNDAKWLSDSHDHILAYAKNKEVWRPNLLPRSAEMDKRYKNPDDDSRGQWKPADFSVKTYNATCDYPITLPSGRIVNPPESRCWVSNEAKFHELKFPVLAAHVWFSETHAPWAGRKKSPLLGMHNGVAYYLLYNGILGERSQSGGNVLTSRVLAELPPYDGAKVIYGEWTPFKEDRLRKENIVFKQTPYDVKAR